MLQNAVVQQIPQPVIQQIPQQVVQQIPHQVVQQFPQTVGAAGGIGAARGVGAAGAYYIPRADNPERILSSTPQGHAQHIHTTPNLSPINLRTPLGFVYPQYEQGSSQAQNTRLNRNLENSLVNPENDRAQVSQNRNPHVNASGQFKPIKGTK